VQPAAARAVQVRDGEGARALTERGGRWCGVWRAGCLAGVFGRPPASPHTACLLLTSCGCCCCVPLRAMPRTLPPQVQQQRCARVRGLPQRCRAHRRQPAV
jgi:hypothetical protein